MWLKFETTDMRRIIITILNWNFWWAVIYYNWMILFVLSECITYTGFVGGMEKSRWMIDTNSDEKKRVNSVTISCAYSE